MSTTAQPSSPSTQEPHPQISEDLKSQKFDLAISLHLHAWSSLTVAVQNGWGGPASAAKRDWFAGAVSDYFADSAPKPTSTPVSSAALQDLREDVECLLLQIMEDEFEVRLEDESEVDVAEKLVRSWGLCWKGDFAEVDEMWRVWEEREARRRERGGAETVVPVTVQEVEEEGEWSEDEDEDGGVGVERDVSMGDAPPLPREKPAPEVDEDGFTKVVGKHRR